MYFSVSTAYPQTHSYIKPYIWKLVGRTVLSASSLSGTEMCFYSMCPVWVWSWSELFVSAHTGSVLCKCRPLRPCWREDYYWLLIKRRKVRLTQGQEASDWRQETGLFISFSLLRLFGLWLLNAARSALGPAVIWSLLSVRWLNLTEDGLSFACKGREKYDVVVLANFSFLEKISEKWIMVTCLNLI